MSAYRLLAGSVILCALAGCGKESQTPSISPATPTRAYSDYTAEQYAAFKQRMLPKTGKTVTARGLVVFGKMGLHMPLEDCDVWIYDTEETDLPCMNELIERFDRHAVTVSGPLRHQDSTAPPDLPLDAEIAIQYVPDHFYFDVAETTLSEAHQ